MISYAKGSFPQGYVPTVFDNYAVTVEAKGKQVTLNLLDTAGQEDYDRLRPLSYANANIFLVCFSVANRDSFENVRDKWIPELRRYAAQPLAFLLVGTQADRRPTASGVGKGEAEALAQEMGAIGYLECSARTREELREVFVEAILGAVAQANGQSLNRKGGKAKKKRCAIV